MVALGMFQLDSTGSPPGDYKCHINKLSGKFLGQATGPIAARYATMLSRTNPFRNWDINQRYMRTNSFITPQTVHDHLAGLEEVRRVVAAARRDGILP